MSIAPASVNLIDLVAVNALLALNNANAVELSWLDGDRLQQMIGQAFLARRLGNADAFLLAFDQKANYGSPNFLWFRGRFERFVYVDRIVVALPARGRGLARRLYADLFEHAVRAGHNRIVCEVNTTPPNPASLSLHEQLGFSQVGVGSFDGGCRTVCYMARVRKACC